MRDVFYEIEHIFMKEASRKLEPGTVVGRHEIVKYVNRGCYGQVYYAKDVKTGDNFAIKVETSETKPPTVANEYKLVKNLDLPRVVKIFSYNKEKDIHYIVEEALGPSLLDLTDKIYLSAPQIAEIGKETLLALRDMHTNNIVHNDFKPANICFRPRSNCPIALIDFGLSTYYTDPTTGHRLSDSGSSGTPRYCAPKKHQQEKCNPIDDLYSWFYTLVELTGVRLPWTNMSDSKKIHSLKTKISAKELCINCPKQYIDIYNYIVNFQSDGIPDYFKIIRLLEKTKGFKLFSPSKKLIWQSIFANMINDFDYVQYSTRQLKK